MSYWTIEPIFDSSLVALAAAIGLALLLLVGPRFSGLTDRRRRILLGLRVAFIVLLLLLMLRPTRISTTRQPQTAGILILADQSRSMQLPNLSEGSSRWDAQRDTLLRAEQVLTSLDDKLDVKLYGYDTKLAEWSIQEQRLVIPPSPGGSRTDIGHSLHDAVRQHLGTRLAAVFLLGDGTQTVFNSDVDLYQAARELGNLGYPLFTIPFGPGVDAQQSRDISIDSLPDQFTVFVKNQLEVRGLMRVRGFVNKDIPVRMIIEDNAGQQQTLGPVTLRASQDGQQVEINMDYVPQQPGQYKLTLAAEVQPGELVTQNNQLSSFLTVLEGGIRVLFLEGEPRQEQKFLRWSIDASPDIDLDFQWLPSRLRSSWPVDLGDAFSADRYDAYILGDLDSTALGDEQIQQLADAVQRGKGLMMMGGYHSFGPGGYQGTPLNDVLPIEMDRFARQDFAAPDRERWHLQGPLPMRAVRDHPVTRLTGRSENARLWDTLPPLQGANRFDGVKTVPGVQVLLEDPAGNPLLVAGESGRGRVLAFAGDSTWQWWRQGFQSEHRRFWRQIVLWLVRRDDLVKDEVWIDLAQRRYEPGSTVEFTCGARTAAGDHIEDATLSAWLVRDSTRQPIPLTARDQAFGGTVLSLTEPGTYAIEVSATAAGRPLGTHRAEFEILDQDLELAYAAADPEQMARLAEFTRQAGGRMLPPEELVDVLNEILRNPPELEEEITTKWRLGDTWWDAWLSLLLLTAVLAVEWTLRKRWRMV